MNAVLCYGTVTWTLTQTTEMEMLRIYCQIQDKGLWRPSLNNAMCNLYKDLNAVDEIKIRRLGWVGHVVRMYAERIPPPQTEKKGS